MHMKKFFWGGVLLEIPIRDLEFRVPGSSWNLQISYTPWVSAYRAGTSLLGCWGSCVLL